MISKKYSLFIDAASKKFIYGVISNGQIMSSKAVETENNLTDLVVEKVYMMLSDLEISLGEITEIIFVIGPGSFTGIRVILTIVRLIKILHPKIVLKSLSLFEIVAANESSATVVIPANKSGTTFFKAHKNDGRIEEMFYQGLEKNNSNNLRELKIDDLSVEHYFQNLLLCYSNSIIHDD